MTEEFKDKIEWILFFLFWMGILGGLGWSNRLQINQLGSTVAAVEARIVTLEIEAAELHLPGDECDEL